MAKKAKSTAAKSDLKEEKSRYLTLEEAKEADTARNDQGVLVTFSDREGDPRFTDVGLLKIRMVSHDGDEMKSVKRRARKGAVRDYNEGKGTRDRVWRWEDLPAEFQRQWEMEVAIASLRGGSGLVLEGSFALDETDPTDETVQAHFRDLLEEAPNWLVSGLYLAGSKILTDPNRITDRMILESRKKGSACGLGRALASHVGPAMGTLGSLGDFSSRIAAVLSAAADSHTTTPPAQAKTTSTRSKSSA